MLQRIQGARDTGSFTDRYSHEQGWLLNQLFYQGFHHTKFDTLTRTAQPLKRKVRFKCNLIQNAVMHRVAKLTSNPPDWDVDSDSQDKEVHDAAEVAERFLEWIWDKEEMPIRAKELKLLSGIFGTSFLHVYWDPDSGEPLRPEDYFRPDQYGYIRDENDLVDAFGDEGSAIRFLEGEDEYKAGEVKIEVVSPFDIYVDSLAKDMKTAFWCAKSSYVSWEAAADRWGAETMKDVEPRPHHQANQKLYKYWRTRFINSNIGLSGIAAAYNDDSVEVIEYWERPCPDYPEGRYAIYANEVMVHEAENPYAGTAAELPLVRFRDVIVPDQFWGSSVIEQAIPMQRALNKVYEDLIKNSHDHGSNKWLVPYGSGIAAGALDRDSDEIIEFNPMAIGSGGAVMPHRIPPGNASNLFITQIQEWTARIQDIFGVHDVSQGKVPSGLKSGVAIQLLQESDDTNLGSVLMDMNGAYARAGRMALDLGKRFIDEDREFKSIAGEQASAKVIEFTGSDLSSRRVRVRMGSLFNRKRAALQQGLMEVLQYGGLEMMESRPEAIDLLFSALGVKHKKVSLSNPDVDRAEYNNKLIESGSLPIINEYDDIEAHLSVLEDRMKRLSFDRLPRPTQDMFRAHRQNLLQFGAQQLVQQQQATMGSAPPGQGLPPQEQGLGSDLATTSAPEAQLNPAELPPPGGLPPNEG